MKLAVLGVGLIGGSIGLAASRRLEAEVTGFDPDRARLDRAQELGAVDAVRAAAVPHVFAGIDDAGAPAILHTTGNRDGHIILRGGDDGPNYGADHVERTLGMLREAGLSERVVIDASHGNSGKNPIRQVAVAGAIADQVAAGDRAIVGIMLESFIVAGRQELDSGQTLTYGQSITDACLDWERTAVILDRLAGAVEARREV